MIKCIPPAALAPVAILFVLSACNGGSDTPEPVPSATPRAAATRAAEAPVDGLAAAVQAAFPAGAALEGENGERYVYANHRLVQAPFGPILLSEGEVPDAAHASAGRIAVTYLRAAGPGFDVVRQYPAAAEVGSFGRVSEWSVSDRFADVPTLETEGGFTGQGYTCGNRILTELRSTGPAEVAEIGTVYDNTGAVEGGQSFEGSITEVVKGQGFVVRYTGSRAFADRYARDGDRWVREGASRLPEC